MNYDRMRIYDAGRFHDTELPDWYLGAERISEAERLNWHRALGRVLDCEPHRLAAVSRRHITPFIAATAQTATADLHRTVANAFIAWVRQGPGTHVDRSTGLSRTDLNNDEMRRNSAAFRASLEQKDQRDTV